MAAIAEHLTETELRAYRGKTMPPDDRAEACAHIAGCAECLTRFSALPAPRSSTAVLEAFTGFNKPWVAGEVAFADSHLTYQEMRDWLGGAIAGLELQRIEAHRTVCETCREDVAKLGVFLKTQQPSVVGVSTNGAFPSSRQRSQSRPAWALFAGSAFAGACAAGLIVYFASVRPLLDRQAASTISGAGSGNGPLAVAHPAQLTTLPTTAPSTQAPTLPPDAAKQIADLNTKLQAASALRAAQDGALRKARQRQAFLQAALSASIRERKDRPASAATPSLPATYTVPVPIAALTKTLTDGKFAALPRGNEFAMNLISPQPITRGIGNVSLVSPVSTVTALTPRAVTFRWSNTSFADHFKIVVTDVTDVRMPKVVASAGDGLDDALTVAEWTSPAPFPRGHLFTWTVTPSRKGLTLSSATAAFRTADAATASRYARLQLALAVAQVRDKLYDPATATLQEVAADFADLPEGAKAAKLRDSLRQERVDSESAP